MKIQDKITFFYALEEKIWNEKIEANQYFGTLSILIVAVSGALVGGSNFLENSFDWNVHVSLFGTIGACLFLWGLNVGESIIASTTIKTMVLRSLLMLGVMAAAFGLGYVLSVVVIIIVTIILSLILLLVILRLFLGAASGEPITLKNISTGEKVKVHDLGIFGHADSSGNTYERQMDGTFEKN